MTYLSKPAAIIKIKLLQNSSAKNYFETNERLFLNNTLENLESISDNNIDPILIEKIESLYRKYQKFV